MRADQNFLRAFKVQCERKMAKKGQKGVFDGDGNVQYFDCGDDLMTAVHLNTNLTAHFQCG